MKKIFIAIFVISGMVYCNVKYKYTVKWVECKVVSHNITSDKYGTAYYNTLCVDNDGNYYSSQHKRDYVKPIGSKIDIEIGPHFYKR